jgi:hypothetical protein
MVKRKQGSSGVHGQTITRKLWGSWSNINKEALSNEDVKYCNAILAKIIDI